jgi:hypothetical protein
VAQAAGVAALIPLLLSVLFVVLYALPVPMTDEWLLVQNAMIWRSATPTLSGIVTALSDMRWMIYEHPILIPNLIYLAVADLVHYDTRAFVAITLACYAGIVLCAAWRGVRGPALLATAFIVFSPAHYMELLWGVQFTLALSIAFPVIGLSILDAATDGHRLNWRRVVIAVLAIGCGILSSAGAAFALPAAAVLVALKPITRASKITLDVLLIGLFAVASLALRDKGSAIHISIKDVMEVLTSFGALLYSSPVGLNQFGLNARSVAGAALFLLDVLLFVQAHRTRTHSAIAFAVALIVFGGLAMSAVAISRGYLGNWHLQYALPFLVGSIGLAWHALNSRNTSLARVPALVVLALVVTGAFGYWSAFIHRGPAYHAYAMTVRNYMLTLPSHPHQPKPFPRTGGWDATPAMVRFLHDRGNPAFR